MKRPQSLRRCAADPYTNTRRQRAFHHAAVSRRMRVSSGALRKIRTPPPHGAPIGLQLVRFGTIRVGRPSVGLG